MGEEPKLGLSNHLERSSGAVPLVGDKGWHNPQARAGQDWH